nr:MAG TPA: hypothetical protein [Inoviridae sp.]
MAFFWLTVTPRYSSGYRRRHRLSSTSFLFCADDCNAPLQFPVAVQFCNAPLQ